MQKVYGYIRVSTIRQGTQGVSLQEQKAAIERYAQNNQLQIVEWFEERETAAKQGRPVFLRMLDNLRQGKTSGVIIHKIDRSARNLKDWAALGDLLDVGIDVHFAHESLDLHARGGRLSADIQAVIAADYIRNLREETKKGFYGRLKQGLYPMRAPLGYLDQGGGQPKIPDPNSAPLIKAAFHFYATGEYSLDRLVVYLADKGLKNRGGGKLSRNGLSTILHNPFYIGLIYIRRTGETYSGIHEPLISKSLFDTVQNILSGKQKKCTGRHNFLFRRMFTCQVCKRSFIGEKQKGHNYYRCHSCKNSCFREEVFKQEVRKALTPLQLHPNEIEQISSLIPSLQKSDESRKEQKKKEIQLRYDNCQSRLDRLTDAYIDNDIEKSIYLNRKTSALNEMRKIEEQMANIDNHRDSEVHRVTENLELLKSLSSSCKHGSNDQKRNTLKMLSSNRMISGKNVLIQLKSPFKELSEFLKIEHGSPSRAETRRLGKLPDRQNDKKSRLNKKNIRTVFEILGKDYSNGKH